MWLVLIIFSLFIPTVLHAKMMDLPVSNKLIWSGKLDHSHQLGRETGGSRAPDWYQTAVDPSIPDTNRTALKCPN